MPEPHQLLTLADARQKVEDWRNDYNEVRPHGTIGTSGGRWLLAEHQSAVERALPLGGPKKAARKLKLAVAGTSRTRHFMLSLSGKGALT